MNIVLDVLKNNKGKLFLPHEIAEEVAGKVRNIKMLRTLENGAKRGDILKLYVDLEIGKKTGKSNAYIFPVGCSVPNNFPCFEPGCSDEYCPRIDIKPRFTYGGMRIVKHEIARKEDIT